LLYGLTEEADYINPLGINSIILTAAELEKGATLTTDSHEAFSVNANLAPQGASNSLITFPLVQGMGLITAIYHSATLLIKSGVYFKQLSPVTQVDSAYRWLALLADGREWAIYIIPSTGIAPTLSLSSDGTTLTGPAGFSGIVQIAKIELLGQERLYDMQNGVYPTSCIVSGQASGSYQLSWQKSGNTTRAVVMFALPHHLDSFLSTTVQQVTNITLQTPTKGNASLVIADQWLLQESLPTT
jgi:endo-1,3(4)-beta-glucanase